MPVIGLGNALMDILINIDNEDIVDKLELARAGMTMIDIETHRKILTATENLPHAYAAGGSAANTVTGIAKLGASPAFIGKVGDDDAGKRFASDLVSNGVKAVVEVSATDFSGKCIALVHPCGERTMATFLGAAITMTPSNVSVDVMRGYSVLYVEGYLTYNQPLVENAMINARQAGLKVALDLSSYNVVEDNIEFITYLCDKYVDIIFANAEEAKAFTGQEAQDALEVMLQRYRCEMAVVKIGVQGSLIGTNSSGAGGAQKYHAGVIDAVPLDKTGAGDLYAAGFLYGYCNGLSVQVCGELGAILSSRVIEVMGPKLTEQQWAEILPMVKSVIDGRKEVEFIYC